MASLELRGEDVEVRLSLLEAIGALSGNLRFPRSSITDVQMTDNTIAMIRGIRAPGTGIPGLLLLGTTRGPFGRDFNIARRHRPGLVITLAGQRFARLVLCDPSPASTRERLGFA